MAAAALLLLSTGCFNSDQDDNSGGSGGALFLLGAEWGRLVDVLDDDGALVLEDVLINHELEGDGINYQLTLNPVTEKESLIILQPSGTVAFDALLVAATTGLKPISKKGLSDAPPYSMVARNAAIRLRFSKLIDPATVDFTTVQVLTGDPPTQAFTGRYVVRNDAATGTGYVIFDPTVSALQAAQGAIPQNAVGFPESFDSVRANLRLRIPTEPDPLFGQPRVLRATDGSRPAVQDPDNEPFELSGSSAPVLVRVGRTGNANDAYGGFMLDNDRPSLLGILDATIADVAAVADDRLKLTYSLDESNCQGLTPKAGDVFEIGSETIVVVTDVESSANPLAYVVRAVVETGDLPVGSSGVSARYTTRYAAADQPLQVCFLDVQPTPSIFPSILIDPNSTITVRFDEPIDGRTMRSLTTFVVAQPEDNNNPATPEEIQTAWFRQVDPNETVADYIDRQRGYDLRVNGIGTIISDSEWSGRILFGDIESSDGNRAFTLTPSGGFADINNNGFLRFTVALRDGVSGITDLAGNPVDFSNFVAGNDDQPGTVSVINSSGGSLGGNFATLRASYFSLSGGSLDENQDGLADWAGQVAASPLGLRGRTPSRFSRSADQTNAAIGARPVGTPVGEPLTPAGAVVMHTYRPQDFGFDYEDQTEYNMGVEGLSWSPANGVVFDETYFDISLSLGPAKFLPDEAFDPLSGNPIFPNSGLVATAFDDNILGFAESGGEIDEQQVFRSSYSPRSVDLYTVGGTPFLSWPEFQAVYNWRDTSIPQDFVGGAQASQGAPNLQYLLDTGAIFAGPWAPEEVPSVALPLLCRFRTYPQSNTLGLNSFQTTVMLAANNNFPGLPSFRVYSAGGQDGSGTWFQVRPDNPAAGGTIPTGGFQPNGSRTEQQYDRQIYWGQADFVVQVSRTYTHWFDMGKILLSGDTVDVVVEPDNALQPQTTGVFVEFRGSVQVDHEGDPLLNPSPLLNAGPPFDAYGDHLGAGLGVGSVAAPSEWTSNFSDLEDQNYKYFQVRATFVANANLGVEPILDGIGIVWKQ